MQWLIIKLGKQNIIIVICVMSDLIGVQSVWPLVGQPWQGDDYFYKHLWFIRITLRCDAWLTCRRRTDFTQLARWPHTKAKKWCHTCARNTAKFHILQLLQNTRIGYFTLLNRKMNWNNFEHYSMCHQTHILQQRY